MKKILSILIIASMLAMAGCSSKLTLAELVESEDVVTGEEETNAALAEAGLGIHIKYSADGEDILVLAYIYDEYQNLNGRSQSEIDAEFAEKFNNLGTSANLDSLFEECEEATGKPLKCIRAEFINADGTIIYSQEYVDTK